MTTASRSSLLLAGALTVLAGAPAGAQTTSADTLIAPRAKGDPKAPVTVYEMGDFQCPFCRNFAVETMPLLDQEYIATGKVRWVFINYPIPSLHPNAEAAAEFAACASREGRFWPTHDWLYADQSKWAELKDPTPVFAQEMPKLGLSPSKMGSCLTGGTGRQMVRSDSIGASQSGAHSTPSFYIEGGLMSGALPVEVFRHVLDSIYAVKTKK
jgi:protein-disulfide isomerase